MLEGHGNNKKSYYGPLYGHNVIMVIILETSQLLIWFLLICLFWNFMESYFLIYTFILPTNFNLLSYSENGFSIVFSYINLPCFMALFPTFFGKHLQIHYIWSLLWANGQVITRHSNRTFSAGPLFFITLSLFPLYTRWQNHSAFIIPTLFPRQGH